MLEGGKVNNRQASFVLPFFIVMPTAVLFSPAITASVAGRDGWIALLGPVTAFGLLVAFLVVKLGSRFPDKTLVEYAPLLLGTFLGKLVGLGYIFWLIHINGVVIREFSEFLVTAFMPETPEMVFHLTLIVLGAWATKSGLEVICRAAEWTFPIFLVSLLIIAVLTLPDADWSQLLPVMEGGIAPLIHGSLAPCGYRGEIILLLFFFPYIIQQHKTGLYLASSVIFMGIILGIVTMLATAILGILAETQVFPFMTLARYISVATFIERLEALILLMWVAGMTLKVAIWYYVAVLGTAQLFNLQDYRPVVFPIGLILMVIANTLFDNTVQLASWISNVFPVYAYTFQLLIPALLLIMAILRKKGGTGNGG